MKRYDTDDAMHLALDVTIFDILSDPNNIALAMNGELIEEPAFADLAPVASVTIPVKALGIVADANDLPSSTVDRVTLGMHLMRDYANGVSPDKQAARLTILHAILDSLGD